MRRTAIFGIFVLGLIGSHTALAAEAPLADKYLIEGKLAEGETKLLEEIVRNPKDDQMRFGLGALQFVRSVERLGQSFHRHGLLSNRQNIPFLRLPVPPNPKPDTITYKAARKILQDFIDDLAKAEASLAKVNDEKVKLPLRVGMIRMELTGAGQAGDKFGTILTRYFGGEQNAPKDPEWQVVFDRGDVAWLRGYCHLLMALAEIALAHDGQELFDCTAHLFFPKVETPHKFLSDPDGDPEVIGGLKAFEIVDIIAVIHLIRMPVKEAGRMKSALTHLEQMLALSKETWKFILAETDDDHEWLPNPKQTGVMALPIRKEMIDSWLEFVDEGEALLSGKRLVPFWRGNGERGINLRRVFTEPRTLDLVLWVQGTAATPYLEKGTPTRKEVWGQLQRVFGGDFIGFAVWFN